MSKGFYWLVIPISESLIRCVARETVFILPFAVAPVLVSWRRIVRYLYFLFGRTFFPLSWKKILVFRSGYPVSSIVTSIFFSPVLRSLYLVYLILRLTNQFDDLFYSSSPISMYVCRAWGWDLELAQEYSIFENSCFIVRCARTYTYVQINRVRCTVYVDGCLE